MAEFFDQSIPGFDPDNPAMQEEVRQHIRGLCQSSTFFLGKAVLGFVDMTDHLHADMATWIDGPSRRKHGIVPRDHLKTSVWTIANSIRKIIKWPDIRILIGNETSTNASHFLFRIEQVWMRNALFRWLFPEIVPDFSRWNRWNATEMLVPRKGDYPEATIEVVGVGGAVVSRHYNCIKLDDLVGKEASESPEVMRKTIDWYQYAESLLEDPNFGEIHNVGTPWGFNDLDAWVRKHEADWVDFFFRSCYHADGTVIWPERFDREALERLRKKYGSFKFSCQYICQPRDPESGSLPWEKLGYYDWRSGMIVPRAGIVAVVIDPMKLARTMRVDPAISEKPGAARSAIIVDGMYRDGRIFLLEAWMKRAQPQGMIEAIFDLAEKWDLDTVGIEAVAYQRVLKPIIEAEASRRNRWLHVIDLRPDQGVKKTNRIRGRIEPVLENGRVWVHEREHEAFIEEMKDFPTGQTVDGLDAFAYGPDMWEYPEDESDESDEREADEFMSMAGRDSVTGY